MLFWYLLSQVVLVGNNLPTYAEDTRVTGWIPESRRYLEVGNGIPLQYSCLENSMGGRAWQAIVHGATKSWTWLSDLVTHTITIFFSLIFKSACLYHFILKPNLHFWYVSILLRRQYLIMLMCSFFITYFSIFASISMDEIGLNFLYPWMRLA